MTFRKAPEKKEEETPSLDLSAAINQSLIGDDRDLLELVNQTSESIEVYLANKLAEKNKDKYKNIHKEHLTKLIQSGANLEELNHKLHMAIQIVGNRYLANHATGKNNSSAEELRDAKKEDTALLIKKLTDMRANIVKKDKSIKNWTGKGHLTDAIDAVLEPAKQKYAALTHRASIIQDNEVMATMEALETEQKAQAKSQASQKLNELILGIDNIFQQQEKSEQKIVIDSIAGQISNALKQSLQQAKTALKDCKSTAIGLENTHTSLSIKRDHFILANLLQPALELIAQINEITKEKIILLLEAVRVLVKKCNQTPELNNTKIMLNRYLEVLQEHMRDAERFLGEQNPSLEDPTSIYKKLTLGCNKILADITPISEQEKAERLTLYTQIKNLSVQVPKEHLSTFQEKMAGIALWLVGITFEDQNGDYVHATKPYLVALMSTRDTLSKHHPFSTLNSPEYKAILKYVEDKIKELKLEKQVSPTSFPLVRQVLQSSPPTDEKILINEKDYVVVSTPLKTLSLNGNGT